MNGNPTGLPSRYRALSIPFTLVVPMLPTLGAESELWVKNWTQLDVLG